MCRGAPVPVEPRVPGASPRETVEGRHGVLGWIDTTKTTYQAITGGWIRAATVKAGDRNTRIAAELASNPSMAEQDALYRHRYPLRGNTDPSLPLEKVLPPSACGPNTTLTVPSKWMTPHLEEAEVKEREKATLLLARSGKYWPVKLLVRQYSCMLSGGWGRFSADNGLQPGDEITLSFSHKHNGCTVVRVDVKKNAFQTTVSKPPLAVPPAPIQQASVMQTVPTNIRSSHSSTMHMLQQANPTSSYPVLQGMPNMMVDFMGTNQKQQQQQQVYPGQFVPMVNVPNSQYLPQAVGIPGKSSYTHFPIQQRQRAHIHEAPNSSASGKTQVSDLGPTAPAKKMGEKAETSTPKKFILMGVEQSV